MSKSAEKEAKKIEKNYKNSNKKIIEFQNRNDYAEKIQELHIPRWEELPSIDLYLDQLVTLICNCFSPYLEDESDSIITKTMINNYVKQGIISPPEKKKYNKEHIACLFVISSLKSVYSISNIASLIELGITNFKIENSYNKFCTLFEYAIKSIFKNKKIDFPKSNSEEEILLQNVIQSVAYKIYVEKTFFIK